MKKAISLVTILFLISIISLSDVGSVVKEVQAKEEVKVSLDAEIPYTVLKKGTTTTVKVTATANGKKISNIVYTSEDKKIATVSSKGVITAKSVGEGRIKVKLKDYSDYCYIWFTVVDRIITIKGPKKFEAGKTYSFTASEKNVTWKLYNSDGDDANASIDPQTGKVKVRNAGNFYVQCTSKDEKGYGSVEVFATGPIIEGQVITLDPITVSEDNHLVSIKELLTADLLPETTKVPYTSNGKKGNVELAISWDDSYNDGEEFDEGSFTLRGELLAPEGYLLKGVNYDSSYAEIDVNFEAAQTDTRKKIVSVEAVDPIIITEDEHLYDYWDVFVKYFSGTKLKCTLEDGSVVELPAYYISYYDDFYGNEGTYECELVPEAIAGYDTGGYEGPRAKLTITIEKKQTWVSEQTLDKAGPVTIVNEHVSQKPLGK